MKIIKLLLLLTFGLWADFKLDVPNDVNEAFYKEVAKVFVQPLYRPINTARFESMRADEMSKEMQQSIEKFLPIYFNTKNPFFIKDKKYLESLEEKEYPEIPIKRFMKVLSKYISLLRIEKRDDEVIVILSKLLFDAQSLMHNTQTFSDLSRAISFYRKTIRNKICDTQELKQIFLKYKPKNEVYFFDILKSDKQLFLNYLLTDRYEKSDNKLPQEFYDEVLLQVKELLDIYEIKFINALKDGSHEAIDEYENYIEKEKDKVWTISYLVKDMASFTILKMQQKLNFKNYYYGSIPNKFARMYLPLSFIDRTYLYKSHQALMKEYNKLLESCP